MKLVRKLLMLQCPWSGIRDIAATTKDIVKECILFRKFKSKKDIILCGVDQERWRGGDFMPEIFSDVKWDLEPDSISRDVKTDILIRADAKDVIWTMLERTLETDFSEWIRQIESWKKERPVEMGQYSKTRVTPLVVIQKINSLFFDVIIAADVWQNQFWTAQFLELTEKKQMLTSGDLERWDTDWR